MTVDHPEPLDLDALGDTGVADVLGDLIAALHDELCYEVSQSERVLNAIERACQELGEPYISSYVGRWS